MAAVIREPLPIDPLLPALAGVLQANNRVVLQAPPGAGKTTRVPLALLDDAKTRGWLGDQRIVMLEPRRVAARAAAHRMAATLNERVGATVGYRVRMDSRVGPSTRIEVVTEGVLTRQLQADPALEGVGLVVFDEFHERSLQADLGLALALESQGTLRPELRLLVMSATLDGARVARLLGADGEDAPVLSSEGRAFPVEIHYAPAPRRRPAGGPMRCEPAQVAQSVRAALAEESGSLLVFLPGVGEIRRVETLLREAPLPPDVLLAPLYGDLSADEQDRAIAPSPPGTRKIVLATAIAETSLTIDGVRVVIDAGLMRRPRFEPNSGMTRLETLRVSQASATQRCGRAGRLVPGACYRLWPEAEQAALAPYTAPEILEADLAPLALELAQWGTADPARLAWLDPPPPAHYAQARALLGELGALDAAGRITEHGRAMATLGMHPRLAHLVLRARTLQAGRLAPGALAALGCELAALLSERDPLRGPRSNTPRETDVHARLVALRSTGHAPDNVDRGALHRIRQSARQWSEQLNVEAPPANDADLSYAGLLLALAYPDRIGQRRPGPEPRYRLANGRGAVFAQAEALSASEYIVAAHLDAGAREARIFLAAAITREELFTYFGETIVERDVVHWDTREEAVVARGQRRLGELILEDAPLASPDPATMTHAMLEGVRAMGLACLPWDKTLRAWRARVQFLHRADASGQFGKWPGVSDKALLDSLETWLAPYLAGCTRRAHLANVDLRAALNGMLDWQQQRALDELAPTHLTVPTGSRIALDYNGEEPVLAVKLQEMFGERDTPRIAGGRVPVLLHLLSPAGRPVQVTRDLAGFWQGSYHDVKKDLKGRYPKHPWPDDPLSAVPTRRAKPHR